MATTSRQTTTLVFVALLTGALPGCSLLEGRGPEPQPEEEIEPGDSEGFSGVTPTLAPPLRLSTLITADRPPPPISGGTLAVRTDGSLVVAADPDRDVVYLIDPALRNVRKVQLAKGSEPGRVVLDATGGAHVALRNTGAVVRIDIDAGSVSSETRVCGLPRGLAYDSVADAVLVACADGALVTLAAATHGELARSFVALDLRDVVVNDQGQRFVSRYRSAELLQVAADGSIVKQTGPLRTRSARFDPIDDGSDMGDTSDEGGPASRGGMPREVTLSAALAWKTVRGHDGEPVMLHQQSQDDEVVISAAGGYGGGCATITQAGVTYFGKGGRATPSLGLAGAALVVDVAVSSSGKWTAVAKPGAYLRGELPSVEVLPSGLGQAVVEADAGRKDAGPVAIQDAGVADAPSAPTAPRSDDPRPSFDAGMDIPGESSPFDLGQCNSGWGDGVDMQATAVAFDGQDMLYVLSREPAQLRIYAARSAPSEWPDFFETDNIDLAGKSVRDTGHELFHADVGTGLACASCHGEALDDGHVWNFRDFGPRRTQNMRGGLLHTLPLHWEGDLPTFQNLVDEVMTRRMGGFSVEPRYANALAQWIDKLPALELGARDPAAAQRGKLLFESAEVACATCHSGEALTNNKTVDVGTGGSFQVPSLRGIALQGPFMHDGCAATLHDRFDAPCGGGDAHGKTSQLDASQVDDLVAYIETL